MKTLTQKEEEIMNLFWENGGMRIVELQAHYAEPKPHVNTLSTLVKILEEKGFLDHRAITARCFKYFTKISREDYRGGSLQNIVNKFFGKNYMNVVNTLVRDEKISVDELKELIKMVEGGE
ncbi:MAG: BlaI/MecI/CopY family transcriptional regulator [Prevotella sp.]|nr:BlaI/MecI/CopY family transcriptional regulator [Prevotella sp.]